MSDTIAAISTPPGRGALAVLRISGPGAGAVLLRVAPSLEGPPPPRTPVLVRIRHPETGELIDRALVTRFAAPASYTGEELVEISGHGGPLVPQLLLDVALASGCRPALPGEFTRRAYLNGKLDLLQAEAVADLIEGRSRALHRAAVHQMERGLSSRVSALRAGLVRAEALLVYSIDFPEEDEPPVPHRAVRAAAEVVLEGIDALLATAPEGELLREGALVVLAGLPNAGKSSLFNALIGTERAIVTDIPGTTRDALEAAITLGGYPFRLVDTAGLRDPADPIEAIGIEVARRYLGGAHVILFCVEAGRPLCPAELAFLGEPRSVPVILVRTKADLPARPGGDEHADLRHETVRVSARSAEGLKELERRVIDGVFRGVAELEEEAPLVTRARHSRMLRSARGEVVAFLDAWDASVPAEFAATHLRSAADLLEELLGGIDLEDVLDAVFGEFCVGK